MLTIDLGTLEYFDSSSNSFSYEVGGIVRFEYSLKAIYDWECKWKKPFLKGELTNEETIDFYMDMALDPIDEKFMTDDVMKKLSNYIGDPNTATVFTSNQTGQTNQNGHKTSTKGKTYTAEEIYALMFEANVDIDFENRNFNRLMIVLRIISSHNSPPKKMDKNEVLRQNAKLNADRKAKMKTKG